MNAKEATRQDGDDANARSSGLFDEADEVLSTDTTEALREAAKKRADQEDDVTDKQRPLVPPVGLMAVHLLQLIQFDQTLTEPDLLDQCLRFKMLVSIGETHKWTNLKKGHLKTVHEKEKTRKILSRVAVDEIKHFSMEIPHHIADPRNVFKIQLYSTYVNTQDGFELIGGAELHLHEIIRAMMVIDVVPLSFNGRLIANLEIEFAFMYGALGFSYSTQLENTAFEPDRDLSHSMFPRVSLPEDRDGEVLTPQPQFTPEFVPWSCSTVTHWNEAEEGQPVGEPTHAPPKFSENMHQAVGAILSEYQPLTTRADRLAFLRDLIRGTNDPRTHVERKKTWSSRPGLSPGASNQSMRVLHSPTGATYSSHHVIDGSDQNGQPTAQLSTGGAEESGLESRTFGPPSRGMFPAATREGRTAGRPPSPPRMPMPVKQPTSVPAAAGSSGAPALATSMANKITAPKQIRRVRRVSMEIVESEHTKDLKPAKDKSIDQSSENVAPK